MESKELFFYELEGRGYTFENMTWLGNCFEDDMLNMAWEMWSSAKHSVKAQAVLEGFVLVPKEPTEAMYIAGADKRQSGGNTADVYKAMIEAQEQSHENG